MKRIIKIDIENFKAYIDHTIINIPNGQNVFIYGENGSGKSSLFKAILHFLRNSIGSITSFEKNIYKESEGKVSITFADFNDDFTQVENSVKKYTYSSNVANCNNNEIFIKNAARTTGFLDYKDLLKVYNKSTGNTNYFRLFVLKMLGNYINISAGATKTISERWKDIIGLIDNAHNRNSRNFAVAQQALKDMHDELIILLSTFFDGVNKLQDKYFRELAIHSYFKLTDFDIDITSPRKKEWKITSNLTLNITKGGIPIERFENILNEACLSSIAICLYFESVKFTPKGDGDLPLLLLDDIFMGLDTSNRIPILKILQGEFTNYQKIIFTYDKYWYTLANRYLVTHNDEGWLFKEMYADNSITDSGNVIHRSPIVLDGSNELDKVRKYLYDKESPDYPAAANYLRKYLEKLLPFYMPNHFLNTTEMETVETYKLTKWINGSLHFVELLHNYSYDLTNIISYLQDISSLLSPLIHPLSHYVPHLPIYKQELQSVTHLVENLEKEFKNAELNKNVKCVNEAGRSIIINLKGDAPYDINYFIKSERPLYYYKDKIGKILISSADFHCIRMECVSPSGTYRRKVNKSDDLWDKMYYTSLENAIESIYDYCSKKVPNAHLVRPTDYSCVLINLQEKIKVKKKEKNSTFTLKDLIGKWEK